MVWLCEHGNNFCLSSLPPIACWASRAECKFKYTLNQIQDWLDTQIDLCRGTLNLTFKFRLSFSCGDQVEIILDSWLLACGRISQCERHYQPPDMRRNFVSGLDKRTALKILLLIFALLTIKLIIDGSAAPIMNASWIRIKSTGNVPSCSCLFCQLLSKGVDSHRPADLQIVHFTMFKTLHLAMSNCTIKMLLICSGGGLLPVSCGLWSSIVQWAICAQW